MKICFLAPANNYHTQKWSKWFSSRGHEIHIVSFIDCKVNNATVHFVDSGVNVEGADSQKLKYLLKAKKVKKIVLSIRPDIINVHYATSYGTVAALAGLKDYILSVWGSDIYDFPQKSFIHKMLLKYSLKSAKYIFSTSKAMADETCKYVDNKIEITPFGVDTKLFNPDKRIENEEEFVVGTVKALTPKYGIEYLIEAVSYIKSERPDIPIKLRIAGKGTHEDVYKKFAIEKEVDDITSWLGYISQEEAAFEWANMDVAVVASTLDSESFGVSAVEAEACGTPVIISDIPGLMEATKPDETCVVVKRKSSREIADAIIYLYENDEVREVMGKSGVQYVNDNYEIDNCFTKIEMLYKQYIEQ